MGPSTPRGPGEAEGAGEYGAGTRLKDVAERAGVSVKTVSHVVRGPAETGYGARTRVASSPVTGLMSLP